MDICQSLAPERRPISAVGLRQPGILIADDDLAIRALLNFAFQSNGFTVWLAEDGAEALRIYRPRMEEIDFVLLDVCMPVMDGYQTLRELQELNTFACCCVMSGSLDDQQERELVRQGATQIFHKPIHPSEVVQFFQDLTIPLFHLPQHASLANKW